MFLVHDQRFRASHVPYHVQGQVMCPASRSLKNLEAQKARSVRSMFYGSNFCSQRPTLSCRRAVPLTIGCICGRGTPSHEYSSFKRTRLWHTPHYAEIGLKAKDKALLSHGQAAWALRAGGSNSTKHAKTAEEFRAYLVAKKRQTFWFEREQLSPAVSAAPPPDGTAIGTDDEARLRSSWGDLLQYRAALPWVEEVIRLSQAAEDDAAFRRALDTMQWLRQQIEALGKDLRRRDSARAHVLL